MLGRDGIVGLVCLAASLGLIAATRGLPEASMLVPVGPGFYPRIVLVITAALSVLLVVADVLARRRAQVAGPRQQAPNYRLVLVTFAIFGVYVALLPYVGFRIATLIFVGALQSALQPPSGWKGWLLMATVAFVTTIVTYFMFEHYLSVLLPRGRWTDF